MNLESIFNAVNNIGLLPVLTILFILFQFRTILRLEKENEKLLALLLKTLGGKKDDETNI